MSSASVDRDAAKEVEELQDSERPELSSSQTADVDSLIKRVRKPEHQALSGWSVMRLLHPFQDRLTRALIGSKIASWQLTATWFIVSLVSYVVSAIGLPATFLAGALILFAAIVIDLCDGEIGRARAQEMSEEEDLGSFIKGMFLDRMCHTICTPIWPMAIAWGLFTLHQHPAVLLAGVALAAYHTACRGLAHIDAYLVVYFQERVQKLDGKKLLREVASSASSSVSIWPRLGHKIELWIRNGKRFNFMILSASIADVVIASTLGLEFCWVLWSGFAVYGIVSVILLTVMLVSRGSGSRLVQKTVHSIAGTESSGN